MSGSSRDVLQVEIQWDEPRSSSNAAEATWGRLSLTIGEQPLWGSPGDGIHWTWIELLEWLADAWVWLAYEQGGPAGLPFMWDPARPQHATSTLERYLESLPVTRRGETHEEAFEFVERHDLARALHGAIVPSVLVLREGHGVWVAGRRLALGPVLESLQGVAESILARLDGIDDERVVAARAAWESRDAKDADTLVMATTGMTIHELEQATAPERHPLLQRECSSPLDSEFLVAARLARTPTIPTQVLDELLELIGNLAKGSTAALDRLSSAAVEVVSHMPASSTAFEEGYALAGWLRGELGLDSEDRIDPEALLQRWGVEIGNVSLSTPEIDAVAVWGPRRRPTVLVNDEGAHNQSPGGRNATLAHEIDHLLIDRGGGLPLAEVIGGHAPVRLEQRARAFAAELLVPRQVAGKGFAEASRPPHAVLQALVDRFGASQEVVAWQARNSEAVLSRDIKGFLRSKVSRPDLF
jgi:Zn-dependent peptidase ImmA (M78 family)